MTIEVEIVDLLKVHEGDEIEFSAVDDDAVDVLCSDGS
jgi:hypothetical protein